MELVRAWAKIRAQLGRRQSPEATRASCPMETTRSLGYDYSSSHCDTFLTESGKEVLDKDSKDS